jgi:hypothetical protein
LWYEWRDSKVKKNINRETLWIKNGFIDAKKDK